MGGGILDCRPAGHAKWLEQPLCGVSGWWCKVPGGITWAVLGLLTQAWWQWKAENMPDAGRWELAALNLRLA